MQSRNTSKYISILLLFISVNMVVVAQSQLKKRDLNAITDQINLEKFEEASKNIKSLMISHPDEPILNLQMGLCLLNMDYKTDDAIPFLEKAKESYSLEKRRNQRAIEARYYLAQAYHLNHRFDEALAELIALKDNIPPKQKDLLKEIERETAYNQNAILLKSNPVNFRISNLGQAINSEHDEHSPLISADETILIFTSNRQGTGSLKTYDDQYYEDIHQSIWREGKWLPALNIGQKINTSGNDATCSLSADGQTMIVYRNDGISGDLYYSSLSDEGWTEPVKFPKPINTDYNETHGSFSYNGNTLVFASDRPGGFGGKDLYMVKKLPDGTWGKIMNLGPTINTIEDEDSPFLSHDETTLYFASMGHMSMGGYDIFSTKRLNQTEQKWSEPKNIGYPINTPGDDLFYSPTIDGQRVYYASERPGGLGRSDIWLIEYPETHEKAMAVVGGFIFTEDGLPSYESLVTVTKKDTGEEMGEYRPHPQTGKYIMILPTGVEFTMTVRTFGKTTVEKNFSLKGRQDFSTRGNASYLDPIVVEDIKQAQ
ncbi:PD40 domain-containing protein [Carboxylicivirga linearis]|uniref:PD40 domain-containing protein n=1 Tax=Carboxylicivirga linearis TaxID=1628157 RepID=A0ABS5JSU6_9BACT|nr:PD40 domain-containing protein [Carboxylicivirga linearis]MBS2097917.1 PD40 domain-containing protein [Carboxylicivirga linearis]